MKKKLSKRNTIKAFGFGLITPLSRTCRNACTQKVNGGAVIQSTGTPK